MDGTDGPTPATQAAFGRGEVAGRPTAPRPSERCSWPRERAPLPDDASFALCLTHDVDRPYKGLRGLYYASRERPAYHLRTLCTSENPYWQFDDIMALEDALGVRSAFYFLQEEHLLKDRPVRDWFGADNWIQHLGRYDVTAPEIADVIDDLANGGWEVGLHGSYHSRDDRALLREQKETIERVLGHSIAGGRQHYLRLSVPETWQHYQSLGLRYDASLGSSTEVGFQHGYRPLRPLGDDFRVFPLTVMEAALPDPGERFDAAQERCESLLAEAAANDAVMTVLWHPRFFAEREFPGYRRLYRWLIERARELGAWIGSPRQLCGEFDARSEPARTRVRTPTTD